MSKVAIKSIKRSVYTLEFFAGDSMNLYILRDCRSGEPALTCEDVVEVDKFLKKA